MTDKTQAPCGADSSAEFDLLPLCAFDHPDNHAQAWTDIELRAIRLYAEACMAARTAAMIKRLREVALHECPCPDDSRLTNENADLLEQEFLPSNTGAQRAAEGGPTGA